MHRHGGDLQNWRTAPCAGNPEWIGKAGPLNHDIETVEVFWSFAKKFSAHPQ